MRRTLAAVWLSLALLTLGLFFWTPNSVFVGVSSVDACMISMRLPALDPLVKPDGRINQVAHFGGDALYCVDPDFNPTNDLSVMLDGGDFRVLDINGQPLWTVPADQIVAAIAQAKATGQGVEVGSGQGSYGPVSLWVIGSDDDGPIFQFNGVDEHGKSNSLQFNSCEPVNPIPSPGTHTSAPPPTLQCFGEYGCGGYFDLSCEPDVCLDPQQDVDDANHNGHTDDIFCTGVNDR